MSVDDDRRVIIIGGGATGVLLAAHLLSDPARALQVTIIEKTATTGLGIAYCTTNPHHLLNVRANNMSAFPDQPGHFWNWVVANNLRDAADGEDSFSFVQRAVYGRYVASLLEPHRKRPQAGRRLEIVHGECVSLRPTQNGIEVTLGSGLSRVGHVAVLATGNEAAAAGYPYRADSPWSHPEDVDVRPDDSVLVLGSGLTMVDYVVSLLQSRHAGPILAISRHGLLPQVHRRVEAVHIAAADVPFGTDVSYVMRWLRDQIERGRSVDLDWRAVIDGLRPLIQEIWQSWPLSAKRRFLRHVRTWWDIHRHRTAPEVDRHIKEAIASGQLKIVAGKVIGVESDASGSTVSFRRRGHALNEAIGVNKVVECVGFDRDPRQSANRVLQSLLKQGLARPDPLGIGIDVRPDCAVIDQYGRASERLFAVGPLTRGNFWEIVSIPDIRIQCAQLAERIAAVRELSFV